MAHRGPDTRKDTGLAYWLRNWAGQLAALLCMAALFSALFIVLSLLFYGHVNW